jgi:hypothetical protein
MKSAKNKVPFLASLEDVQKWFQQTQRKATTNGLKGCFLQMGIQVKYKVIYRVLDHLKKTHFIGEKQQYTLVQDYIAVMNRKGHKAELKTNNGGFKQLCILYAEGMQSFEAFYHRGLQLDGTFLKTKMKGTLFLACVKDTNNEIRVVGLSIASGENYDNWDTFLKFLSQHIRKPGFIISDREKGLLKAVATNEHFKDLHHAYCFKHLSENFYLAFKSKPLKAKKTKEEK